MTTVHRRREATQYVPTFPGCCPCGPRLVATRLQQARDDLVDRLEVIVKRTVGDVRLLGYVVDGCAIDSLAPKNEFGRSEDGFACRWRRRWLRLAMVGVSLLMILASNL